MPDHYNAFKASVGTRALQKPRAPSPHAGEVRLTPVPVDDVMPVRQARALLTAADARRGAHRDFSPVHHAAAAPATSGPQAARSPVARSATPDRSSPGALSNSSYVLLYRAPCITIHLLAFLVRATPSLADWLRSQGSSGRLLVLLMFQVVDT
jgi:hypothetical protein